MRTGELAWASCFLTVAEGSALLLCSIGKLVLQLLLCQQHGVHGVVRSAMYSFGWQLPCQPK
jgi:hypothetical protein